MPHPVTIRSPAVIALIESAAAQFTNGNKTAAVALALRQFLDRQERAESFFGAHRGSVRVRRGVDLTAPLLDKSPDAISRPWAANLGRKGPRTRRKQ